jgi:hypothetical protein
MGQALCLRALLSCVPPAKGAFPVSGPYRVLLFVIHDDLVDRLVFFVMFIHFASIELMVVWFISLLHKPWGMHAYLFNYLSPTIPKKIGFHADGSYHLSCHLADERKSGYD